MFKLRPFKNSDAACMPSWIIDEREFYFWSAGKFTYPLTADQIIAYAEVMADEQTAWPMTVLAENGSPAGHILLRRADYLQRSIHLGFVLLAPQYRGNGCGQALLRLIKKYVQEILGMQRLTLGVFTNNLQAVNCYKRGGFKAVDGLKVIFPLYNVEFLGEQWEIIEMEWLTGER